MLNKTIRLSVLFLLLIGFWTFGVCAAQAKRHPFPAGKWQVNANNHKGVLYLEPGYQSATAATHYGVIFGDRITPITFNASNGEIRFFRPKSGQEYVGKVRGNQITGTFSSRGQVYPWQAWQDTMSSTGGNRRPHSSRRRFAHGFPSGKWDVNANNHTGLLELWETGQSTYKGSIFGEPIANIAFDHHTGEIRFNRPSSGQQYTGLVRHDSISGEFIQNNRTYPWRAEQSQDNYAPQGSGSSYSRRPPRTFPGGLDLPSGSWHVEANQHRGELYIPYSGGHPAGSSGPQVGKIFNDRITDIRYNERTGELRFVRPGSDQHYVGIVNGSRIEGSFTQPSSGNGQYPWRAWR